MSATNELFSPLNIIEKINVFIHIDEISNFREDFCLKAISSNNVFLQIFQRNFYEYYQKKISTYFSQISNIIFCHICNQNINSDLSICFDYHTDLEDVDSIFENLIFLLNNIYNKEKCISLKEQNNIDLPTFQVLILENIHLITKIFQFFVKICSERFKQNFIIKEENIIKDKLRVIMEKINLFNIFERIVKEYLKFEINSKVEEFKHIYDKMILNEIINLFNNLFLEWGQAQLKQNSNLLKQEFIEYIKKVYIDCKTNQFFDIITNYPDSHCALIDIKFAMTQSDHRDFISKVKDQISQRLLTPGIATPLIIEIFIRIIKMLKFIDPSSYILEVISIPIKHYLRQRKDTMRWIITTILNEDDNSIKEDLGKQYIKSTFSLLSLNKDNDYDYLSSDEDEAAAESWHPRPIYTSTPSNKSKFSDIISTLVNIFGSPEKFVEQYKRMLAERSVSDTNFSLENEIKNLELLKIKFGENLLQGCDIIIKDVNDSSKINSMIKSDKNENIAHTHYKSNDEANEFDLNCLIINKNFWPFKDSSMYSLEVEGCLVNNIANNSFNPPINTKNYDKFLTSVNNKLLNYKKKFSATKFSRTLNYFTNIGFVDLTLTFENGTFNFRVSQLSALIINLFDETNEKYFENFSIDFISEKLNSSVPDVKMKINFWISKGVLSEYVKKVDSNNVDDVKNYFIPNKILKNFDLAFSNNLIIEEEIYHFDYVENETNLNLENAINSIIKNSGPRNFEQLYKNLIISYQVTISEIKLKEVLGKMILEQKIFKEGEMYKLIVPTY